MAKEETANKSDEPTRELIDDGGMYPTESSHVDAAQHTVKAAKIVMGEAFDGFAKWRDIDFLVQQEFAFAVQTLRYLPKDEKKIRPEEKKIREEAKEVVRLAGETTQIIAGGKDIKGAAVWAFHLGITSERLRAMIDYDKPVRIGRRKQRMGREHAAVVADDRRKRRKEMKTEIDNRRKKRGRHKTPSDAKIYTDVAERFGVSIPTVRRADGKK
jgi:hypothetical protein